VKIKVLICTNFAYLFCFVVKFHRNVSSDLPYKTVEHGESARPKAVSYFFKFMLNVVVSLNNLLLCLSTV
jgi:hypothetical protein